MVFRVNARTVLELGSELISSDIIAFYELVKNAFDAQSPDGADIRFDIVLRRNAYLRLRNRATDDLMEAGKSARRNTELLQELKSALERAIDGTSGGGRVATLNAMMAEVTTIREFIVALDNAYASLNTIVVADTGVGMSAEDLSANFLTIGTSSRKREVDRALAAGNDASPYLGEKGIGRLSAMRLGNKLKVTTARVEDRKYNILDLDWRKFADIEAKVEDIEVEPRIGGQKKSAKESGTELEIGDLTEDWSEKKVKVMADYDFARLNWRARLKAR